MIRVAIYLRRSTDDEHQPYSIEAQDTRLGAYIASQPNWQLVLRFADDASGATTERPDLQRALAAAKAGLYDVLLVYRVDRFSRNLRDTVTLLDELDAAGVSFRSATEPFDTATPMGRLLLQMLAMFAQFERDTIIDRVIAGMERKAAKGLWKGGRRPFGYQVDKTAQKLVVDEAEAAIIRVIFDLYVNDRLGSKAIARILNDRGHRTTTGGPWSGHQVNRALTNRVYLGELTFRDTTLTGTHDPIIDPALWAKADRILAERGENYSRRASNGSDYQLTGRLRYPTCAKAMIGTRATGRNRTYRYYTCFTRARYDSDACDAPRLDADAVDTAVLDALARFYTDHLDLITAAVEQHRAAHRAANGDRLAELTAIDTELARADKAIDRNLSAYENGTLDEETLAERLPALRATTKQLRRRREQLTIEIDNEPHHPDPATLAEVAQHITDIITAGTDNQRKGLIEALIDRVVISAPDALIPVFRIPQPTARPASTLAAAHLPADAPPAATTPEGVVRAMTNSVDLPGIEPAAAHHRRRRRRGRGERTGERIPLDVIGGFDLGLLRQGATELGVDLDNRGTVLDLAAVVVTRLAWRDGPVEGWQRGSNSRISGGEMMRASAATTRLVRALLDAQVPALPWPAGTEFADRPGVVFLAIGEALADPDRRLPDGRRMADVAPNRRQLDMYCRQARGLCRRWADMADGVGLHTALLLLACWAAATCRHWWLAPDWPQLVDRFVGQLDDPRCAAGDPRALDCERPLPDRGQLRRQLLDGPDRLSSQAAEFCARSGVGLAWCAGR